MHWLEHTVNGPVHFRELVLTHGEDTAREAFASRAKEELDIARISLPREGDIIDFNKRVSQVA